MHSRRYSLLGGALALVVAAVLIGSTGAPPARAGVAWNSAMVLISGTVTGEPESVTFSGDAEIQTRLAVDPEDSSRSKLLLQFDLSGVIGLGASTAVTYVIPARDVLHRPLVASDEIRLTFPFHASGADASSARSGLASFALGVDTATGVITSATASIGSPDF